MIGENAGYEVRRQPHILPDMHHSVVSGAALLPAVRRWSV